MLDEVKWAFMDTINALVRLSIVAIRHFYVTDYGERMDHQRIMELVSTQREIKEEMRIYKQELFESLHNYIE